MTATQTEAGAQRKVTVVVDGMTCAACSGRVQRALEKSEGVGSANVNLMMRNATIEFDPARTSTDRLLATIRDTGYGAELPPEDISAFEEQEAQDAAQEEEFRVLARKAAVSFLAAAVGMILSMPVMAAVAAGVHGGHVDTGDPFMRWSMQTIDPWLRGVLPSIYQVDHRVWLGVLLTQAMEAGLLLSVTADKVIRLVPPLILTSEEAAEIAARLVPLVKAFLAAPASAPAAP